MSQYFWPEPFIINDLVLKLKDLGHNVSVFTGKPNYPDGAIYPGYIRAEVHEEFYEECIPVYRIPLRPRNKGGAKNLTLNYLSFVFSGLKHAFKFSKNKQIDVIFVFAISPITAAIPAILIKWLTKSHLTIWVQDLWPESVKATGFIKNPFLLKCVGVLVRGIYFCSDTLLAQSKAFIPHISKYAHPSKVDYYPNSVMDNLNTQSHTPTLTPELMDVLDTQFCLIFAGNLGTAQALDILIQAAELVRGLKKFRLILVGSGSQRESIKRYLEDNHLTNVILAGRYPAADMPFLFSKASGLLVSLKKDDIFTYTIPSKIQSYLAAAKPILASLDGEGARIVKEAGAGFSSPAEDAEALAKNIKHLYDLPQSARDEMGKKGRAYFLKHFEMTSQSQRLIELFEQRIRRKESA